MEESSSGKKICSQCYKSKDLSEFKAQLGGALTTCCCVCLQKAETRRKRIAGQRDDDNGPSKRQKVRKVREPLRTIPQNVVKNRQNTRQRSEIPAYHRLDDEANSDKENRRVFNQRLRIARHNERTRLRGDIPSQATPPSPEPARHEPVRYEPTASPPIAAVVASQPSTVPSIHDDPPDNAASDNEFEADGEILEYLGNLQPLHEPEPILRTAISEEEFDHIKEFYAAMDSIKMEECTGCSRKWWDLDIVDDLCKRCRKAGDRFQLWSDENNCDPGNVPVDLPALHPMEELLISPYHPHIQVYQIRGAQYKYSGHTVTFAQNHVKIARRLPRLPQDISELIVRPPSNGMEDNEQITRLLSRRYKVRREPIRKWLEYLMDHHPGFASMRIDAQRIADLPEDGSIQDSIPTRVHIEDSQPMVREPSEGDPREDMPEQLRAGELDEPALSPLLSRGIGLEPGPPGLAVPGEDDAVEPEVNLFIPNAAMVEFAETEAQRLFRLANHSQGSSVLQSSQDEPSPAPTPALSQPAALAFVSLATLQGPISEWDPTSRLFSMAYPTLFPTGKGDYFSPRTKSVALSDWIRNIMLYKDGRFARHPLFRYAAFNVHFRREARTCARYFVNRAVDEAGEEINGEYLQEMVRDGRVHELLNLVKRASIRLPGTAAFWGDARHDLIIMVGNILAPHLFFTFSAADMQWLDLHRLFPEFATGLPDGVNPGHKARLIGEALRDNPHIAAAWFVKRFELFFEHVFKRVFNVADFWYRFEWQSRGSTHVHGFVWLNDAPLPSMETTETTDAMVEFWSSRVFATNPSLPYVQVGSNPASVPFFPGLNTEDFLGDCLNWFQRHTRCTKQYCLRKKTGAGAGDEEICRFYFPKKTRTLACIDREFGGKMLKFQAIRNDGLMNPYIPCFTLGWRANTDATPCLNVSTVIDYMGKYATKAEKTSTSMRNTMRDIVSSTNFSTNSTNSTNSNGDLLKVIHRALNALIVDRDWSAQEVCHVLLKEKMWHSSRTRVNLNLTLGQEHGINVTVEAGEVAEGLPNFYVKYSRRCQYRHERCTGDRPMSEVSLFEFVVGYSVFRKPSENLVRVKFRPRGKPRILNVWPVGSSDCENDLYEEYCRVKVMLHHPWIDDPEVLQMEDSESGIRTWRAAFEHCQANCLPHPPDPLGLPKLDEVPIDNEFESTPIDDDLGIQPGFADVAGRTSNFHNMQGDDLESGLGARPQDINYNWHANEHGELDVYFDEYQYQTEFVAKLKETSPSGQPPIINPNLLQPVQRQVYDTCMAHLQAHWDGLDPPQILLHVDGKAGTGKSFTIDCLSTNAHELAKRFHQDENIAEPIVRAGPTGISAVNIRGRTLHSLLRLPIRKQTDLFVMNATLRHKLQQELDKVRLLIIDEKSMIGQETLWAIDQRLRELRAKLHEPFGGMSVLLCGDFYQLPPVGQAPLYALPTSNSFNERIIRAKEAYSKFDRTIVLETVMRQAGDEPDAVAFKDALDQLRSATDGISHEAFELLHSRVQAELPTSEVREFAGAMRLYATKAKVRSHNVERLISSGKPVICIKAAHHPPRAKDADEDEAQGLYASALYAKEAKVMLTVNLATHLGLVNGTIGVVHDIVWHPDHEPHEHLPQYLLFAIESEFDGPHLFKNAAGRPVIPILPVKRTWKANDGSEFSRTMLPIVLAFAITIHKSQGLTLDRVVLNFDTKDFAAGLSYVAISRVRKLKGLMFETSMLRDRFITPRGSNTGARELDRMSRALQIVSLTS